MPLKIHPGQLGRFSPNGTSSKTLERVIINLNIGIPNGYLAFHLT
jgi:hypothetical protein